MVSLQGALLALDDERGLLGLLCLDLIRRGIGVLYANDIDELALLSRELGSAGVTLLAPNELALEVSGRTEKRIGIPPQAIVPVGERPDEAFVERCRVAGMRWHLWACGNAEEAQYVINAILRDLDDDELRSDARAPCRLAGEVNCGTNSYSVVVADIGTGGVCTLWTHLPQKNAAVQVAFRLGGEELKQDARIGWVQRSDDGQWRVGLPFCRVQQQTERVLRQAVVKWMDAHRITAEGASD